MIRKSKYALVLLLLFLPVLPVQSEVCIYGASTFEDGSNAESVLTIYKPNGQFISRIVSGEYAICPSAMLGTYTASAHMIGYTCATVYTIEALTWGEYKGNDFVFSLIETPTLTPTVRETYTVIPSVIPSVTPTFYWPTPPPIPTRIPTVGYTVLTGTWLLDIGSDGVCELTLFYEGEPVVQTTLWDGMLGDYLRGR